MMKLLYTSKTLKLTSIFKSVIYTYHKDAIFHSDQGYIVVK